MKLVGLPLETRIVRAIINEPSAPADTFQPEAVRMRRSTLALLAVALVAFASGCVKVAPYERGMLAHPTMTAEEISIGLDGHVRAVSEGAAGGLGGGGGGCGCN